ncbi:MAG: HPr family phosphocarrier protein [bacterium]|nr:HPr family phosphocarrier protein [bacterium]
MQTFEHVIKDEMGLHARPAGLLVKEAKKYKSTITVSNGVKSANATKLIMIMGMGVKSGETITITIEGEDEDTAFEELKAFFETNV